MIISYIQDLCKECLPTYTKISAMNLHFNGDGYDYGKYNGKLKINESSLINHKNRKGIFKTHRRLKNLDIDIDKYLLFVYNEAYARYKRYYVRSNDLVSKHNLERYKLFCVRFSSIKISTKSRYSSLMSEISKDLTLINDINCGLLDDTDDDHVLMMLAYLVNGSGNIRKLLQGNMVYAGGLSDHIDRYNSVYNLIKSKGG